MAMDIDFELLGYSDLNILFIIQNFKVIFKKKTSNSF